MLVGLSGGEVKKAILVSETMRERVKHQGFLYIEATVRSGMMVCIGEQFSM